MVWGLQGTGSNDNIVTKTFGTAGGRQHWVFFSSYTAGSWSYWSIVMEEGTDNIYIVDQRHSTAANPQITAGIQIDGSTATMVAGSPHYLMLLVLMLLLLIIIIMNSFMVLKMLQTWLGYL